MKLHMKPLLKISSHLLVISCGIMGVYEAQWHFICSVCTFLRDLEPCIISASSSTIELAGVLLLLKVTAKPQYRFKNFFASDKSSYNEGNWFLASAIGVGFLFMLVFSTSFLADRIVGPQVGIIEENA